MPLIFSTDFENGSLIEKVSGDLFTKVNNPIFKTSKKGLGLYTKGGYITKPNFSYNPTNKISFEITTNVHFVNLLSQIFIYTLNSYSTPYIIVYRSGAGDGKNLYVYYWTGSVQTAVSATNFFSTTSDYHIGITFDFSTGICIIYKNGILFGTYNPTTPQFPNLNYTLSLFGGTDQNQYTNYGVKYYDHILQSTEVADGYNEFLNAKSISKQKSKIIYPPILAKTTDGLIAEYNFVNAKKNIVVNEAPSSSANGNNPNQFNLTFSRFNWFGSIISRFTLSNTMNLGTNYTIVYRRKYKGTNEATGAVSMLNGGSGMYTESSNAAGMEAALGAININKLTSSLLDVIDDIIITRSDTVYKLYVNGVYNNTSTRGVNVGNFSINIIQYFLQYKHNIINFRFYNRVITEQEILDYHNQYATQPILLEDFSDYAVNTFPNKNWKSYYGLSYINIKEISTNINQYLKKGTKYLFIEPGYTNTHFNSKVAYGTWEFDFYMTTGNYGMSYLSGQKSINNLSANHYCVNSSNGNSISFSTPSNGTLGSVGGITQNTWYHIKITRNQSNLFSFYIDGVFKFSASNSQLTTCSYFVTNRSLANIKITEGIIV